MRFVIREVMAAVVLTAAITPRLCAASDQGSKPPTQVVRADATVHVPQFDLPASPYMSDEAKAALIESLSADSAWASVSDIGERRRLYDQQIAKPRLQRAKALYPVALHPVSMGGVSTVEVTPKQGVANGNRDRVLINLHGGSFSLGGGDGGLLESIPIAGVGKIKVVTVDYRQGPEFRFPAASVDVAAVYKELLRSYEPRNIGIYGCSSGGWLTAMAVAWFEKERLPQPGAVGILCAGGSYPYGDSAYTSQALAGRTPVTPERSRPPIVYLSDADPNDPLVWPALSMDTLKRFPPTLFVTGTRAQDMSSTIYMHRRLVKAGVEADLQLWDGMWHGFFYSPELPESKEAFDVIVRFFDQHLGRAPQS